MYFAKDQDTAFQTAVFNVRYAMRSALSSLTEGKHCPAQMVNHERPGNWASTLSWRCEGWMMESMKLDFLQHIAHWMGDQTQEAWGQVFSDPDSDSPEEMEKEFDAKLEVIAANMRRWVSAEYLRIIYRGVETSSNPLTIILSKSKIEAAKHIIEVCGLSEHRLFSYEAMGDIMDGMAERKRKEDLLRDEQIMVTPTQINVDKVNGIYTLIACNARGESVDVKELETVSRKPDAIAIAKQWAIDLRQQTIEFNEQQGWKIGVASISVEA